MGYPYCRGTAGGSDRLSANDRKSLRYGYNRSAWTSRDLNSDGRDDILWHQSGADRYTVWFGANEFAFVEEEHCFFPSCSLTPSGWMTSPVEIDGGSALLMQGRGGGLDLFLEFVEEDPLRFQTRVDLRTSVPVVGDFNSTAGTEELFFVPGPGDSDVALVPRCTIS